MFILFLLKLFLSNKTHFKALYLCRRLNVQKEITLHDVIKKRWHCGPAEFSVRDKFMLNEVKVTDLKISEM